MSGASPERAAAFQERDLNTREAYLIGVHYAKQFIGGREVLVRYAAALRPDGLVGVWRPEPCRCGGPAPERHTPCPACGETP